MQNPTTTIGAAAQPSLKELGEAEFRDRYSCDHFTATFLTSRFRYVIDHVCGHLQTNVFSPILRDFSDFSATISGPPELHYDTPAVAKTLAVFFGSMRDAVANSIAEFGVENLRPGDVLICNDPYRAGTHVNDICFMRPLFAGERLVGVLTIRAHMMDMGGTVPGGFAGTKKNVYESGLVIPPMLFYREDQPIKSAYSLILDNARFGQLLLPDMEAIFHALRLGERLTAETIDRYGVDAFLGSIRYGCDASAEAMTKGLASLPDGVYEGEDIVDADAIDAAIAYRVAVRINKVGGRAEVDVSESSHQARTSINGTWADIKTSVALALKFLLDPLGPFTSGTLRPIDIVAPSGSLLSAEPPDGAIFLYWEAIEPTVAAVFRALRPALGERAIGGASRAMTVQNATGVAPDGTPFANVFNENGGWGATASGDADSAQKILTSNFMDAPVEQVERFVPVMVTRNEYAIDSGGPGRFRGGAGICMDTHWVGDADNHITNSHARSAPGDGVCGGRPGRPGGVWLWEPGTVEELGDQPYVGLGDDAYRASVPVSGMMDPETLTQSMSGDYHYWGARDAWHAAPGAVIRKVSNGAGGWGDPFSRDPEAVRRDVRDEYVSVAAARRDYGVVVLGDPELDPEGLTVDAEATAELRAAERPPDQEVRVSLAGARLAPPVPAPPREAVEGRCEECGGEDLQAYAVLAERGWLQVVKCQGCLASVSRTPWNRMGWLTLLEDSIE